MSILDSIMSKIFHGAAAAANVPGGAEAPGAQAASVSASGPAAGASAATSSPAASLAAVDVEAVLSGLAAQAGQPLDWRHSIVDLMKLLQLDSGLAARKRLAEELHYMGSTSDSAAMNIWLHKEVMRKFAESGGKVPDDLKA
jgi:hypothetical protein